MLPHLSQQRRNHVNRMTFIGGCGPGSHCGSRAAGARENYNMGTEGRRG